MAIIPPADGERLRRLIESPIPRLPPRQQEEVAPARPGFVPEFGRGFRSALGGVVSGFGQVAADLPGTDQGNALQRFGQDVLERNVSSIQQLSDIPDNPTGAFGSATGNAAGSVASMVGARAVGSAITAAAPTVAAVNPVLGAGVAGLGQLISFGGPAAALFARSFGGIRQEQIANDPDAAGSLGAKAAASVGGAASAAIERFSGGERLAGILLREGKGGLAKRIGKEGAKQGSATTLTGGLRNLATGPVARTALSSAITETIAESLQTPIEQLAAFQNPLKPESLEETAFGAAMGFLGGAGIGGAFGAVTPRGKDTVDPGNVTNDDLTNTVDGALSGQGGIPLALPAPVGPAFEVSSQGVVTQPGQIEQALAQTDDIAERARLLGLGEQPVRQDTPVPGQLALPSPEGQPLEVSPRGVVAPRGGIEQALAQTTDIAERARILGLGEQVAEQASAPQLPPFQQAVSAVPSANLKGMPSRVRNVLAEARTPEALEEAIARELHTRLKAGSTANYVNNPNGALQSLYRAVTGSRRAPTLAELDARFDPQIPQSPTEQPALFEVAPQPESSTAQVQGDLFQRGGTQQVDLRPAAPVALSPEVTPAAPETTPPAVAPEVTPAVAPEATPATVALEPERIVRAKKAPAKRATAKKATAESAAPSAERAATQQPASVSGDLAPALTAVEARDRSKDVSRLRSLKGNATKARNELAKGDNISDARRQTLEKRIEDFEQAQAEFNDRYSVQHSRGTQSETGTHTVESVLNDIKARVGAAISNALGKRFVVVQSLDDARNDMRRRGSFNTDLVQNGAKGIHDPSTGVSYIIAENMTATDSAWGVLLHEMGVHFGLRRMLGDSGHGAILRDVGRFLTDGDAAFVSAARRVNVAESLGLNPDAPDFAQQMAARVAQNSKIGEEILGYFSENTSNHNRSLWRRTVVAVRKFLRKAGLDLPLDTQDVMDIVQAATLNAVNEKVPNSQRAMERDAHELLADFGHRAVQQPDGTVDIVDSNGRVVADENVPTQLQIAAATLKYPGMSAQLLEDIQQTGPLYSRGTARGPMGDPAATAAKDFGTATNFARSMKASVLSALKPNKGGAISSRLLRTVVGWADRNTITGLYDNWFDGALGRNAQTYANQEVTAARIGQLFNTAYKRLEGLERTDLKAYTNISKIMQATEFNLNIRKTWDQNTHLHSESAEDQVVLKRKHSEFRQIWGKLTPEQRGIYSDLVGVNETTYFAEMAVTLQNMVAGEDLDPTTKAVFASDATERFRNDPTAHEDVDVARKYWKDVLDKYIAALDAYTTAERAKLPIREPTTPEDQAAITSAMKGLTDPAQRRRVRRMLLAGRQAGLTPDQRNTTKILNRLDAQLEVVRRSVKSVNDAPYFHMGRFGNYFVGFNIRTDADGVADPAAMREVVNRLTNRFPDISMRSDADSPSVYVRFESADNAQAFVNALENLRQEGLLDTTGESGGFFAGVKSDISNAQGFPAWLSRVIENIRVTESDSDTANRMIADLRAMYLESLPDRSVSKVMAHRKGIQGYSANMVRSYAHRTHIAANHIAGLSVSLERQDTFRQMSDVIEREQIAKPTQVDRLEKLNIIKDELTRRDAEVADPQITNPYLSMLRALGHVYFLGMSPAYFMMNIMQVGALGVPELSKRFGPAKSTSAVLSVFPDAMRVVYAAIREGYRSGRAKGAAEMIITSDVLASANLSPELSQYIVEVMGTGRLDIGTMSRNMGRIAAGEVASAGSVRLDTGLKIATSFTLMSEMLARTTMALAARKLHGADGVMQYSMRVLDNSMLNYSSTNVARQTGTKGVIGGLTPTALQFHQYSFQALGRLVTEGYNAFVSRDGVSAQERVEAQRFVKSHIGAMMVLAGTMGLPFMTVAARISDLLCEMFGDTPCDTKADIRNFTHDVFGEDIEPIISRGALRMVGGDLSSRIGEADFIPFSRFMADRRTLSDKLNSPVLSISGATGGMVSNIVSGAQKIADGDLWGGMQSAVPVALQGPLKAYSLSQRGFTDSSGLTLPMEVTATDILMRALGVQPGKEADFAQARRTRQQRTGILNREVSVIRSNIVRAIEQQDRDALVSWGRRAAEFQQNNPGTDIVSGVRSSLRQRQRAIALGSVGVMPGTNLRDVGAIGSTRFFQPGVQ